MDHVRVSVLMTVYNEEAYVREAIDSALNQTFTDLELIIIDDGSTDGTPAILEDAARRDSRVRVISAGRVASRPKLLNQAVEMSRGEYVAILDADDVALPQRIERQCEVLDDKPHVGVVGSSCIVIDRAGGRHLRIRETTETDAEIRNKLFDNIPFAHSTMMMRRSLVQEIGGYDARYPYPHDYDLVFRMAEVALLAGIAEPLVLSRNSGYFGGQMDRWSRTREVIQCRWANWKRQGRLRDLRFVFVLPLAKAIGGSVRQWLVRGRRG